MFGKDVIDAIHAAADERGLEAAALLAVAEVESGGRAFAVVEGRQEPLIRFEGHYFDRRLSGAVREKARRAGLASPDVGGVANPASQAARWSLLGKAAALDRKAAYESVSWGIGQVMGAHWAWLGYASVDKMAEEARSGVQGQMRLMLRYIEKAGLLETLRRRDWAGFARGYNGPLYARNRYDVRMAAAYARYAVAPATGGPTERNLRLGMRGDDVARLQQRLVAFGSRIREDGVFGAETKAAVIAFQAASGLRPDGVVGPLTRAALADGRQEPGFWTSILGWITRLIRGTD